MSQIVKQLSFFFLSLQSICRNENNASSFIGCIVIRNSSCHIRWFISLNATPLQKLVAFMGFTEEEMEAWSVSNSAKGKRCWELSTKIVLPGSLESSECPLSLSSPSCRSAASFSHSQWWGAHFLPWWRQSVLNPNRDRCLKLFPYVDFKHVSSHFHHGFFISLCRGHTFITGKCNHQQPQNSEVSMCFRTARARLCSYATTWSWMTPKSPCPVCTQGQLISIMMPISGVVLWETKMLMYTTCLEQLHKGSSDFPLLLTQNELITSMRGKNNDWRKMQKSWHWNVKKESKQ
jgi:hypothetical protein